MFAGSFDVGGLLGPDSFQTIFTLASPITAMIGVSDANGYAHFTVPNPNTTASGGTLVGHSIALLTPNFQISNPFFMQFK